MEKVERRDLVPGEVYYLDASRKSVGVFAMSTEHGVYFDCTDDVPYIKSSYEPTKGLVGFMFEGDGFEPVLTLL